MYTLLTILISNCRFGARLVSIEENSKFRKPENETGSDAPSGLKDFVSEIKKNFDLKYVIPPPSPPPASFHFFPFCS